jgi:hypothetical protein
MSYYEHLERLSDRAERIVDDLRAAHAPHGPSIRFIEHLPLEGVCELESCRFDRSYVTFTVSIGLMCRWMDPHARLEEHSDIMDRALERSFSNYRIAQAGYAMSDLSIAHDHGYDVSAWHDTFVELVRGLAPDQKERALSWIALTTRR